MLDSGVQLNDVSSVNGKDSSRNVACHIAGEEQEAACDFLRLSDSAKGDRSGNPRYHIGRERCDHICSCNTGSYRVYSDIVLSKLAGKALCKTVYRKF